MDTIFEGVVGNRNVITFTTCPYEAGQSHMRGRSLLNGEERHDCAGKAEDESQDSPKLAAVVLCPHTGN